MRFTKLLALVGLFAGSALAAPTEDPRPQKPAKPAPAPPTNGCEFSSQCSQTVICCNAQNSVQVCVGNAELFTPPYYPYDF
ncbi:MAG: hypothetical protein L6R38_006214 [Xanthoria sp. 2 TBL-2021]|nr:MAG: hypothetical protein L6R38_006214 [Xanthoria sp. 2 TBL-2021]